MESIKYFLVLEKRPGDYSIIDINKLDIHKYEVDDSIAGIDNWTKDFTEIEIKESISRSNMVKREYLSGKLKIISNKKHYLPVLSKEIYDNIFYILNSHELDQSFKDKIYSHYRNYVEPLDLTHETKAGLLMQMREALKHNNTDIIIMLINLIPHNYSRHIFFEINGEYMVRQRENIIRSKKLNDIE